MNTNIVSDFILEYFYWVFLAILMVNLFQRKHQQTGEKKRFATLFIAIMVFAVFAFAGLLVQFSLPDLLLIPFLAVTGYLAWKFRARLFPFTMKCRTCGARLDQNRILFHDSNLCVDCDTAAQENSGQE